MDEQRRGLRFSFSAPAEVAPESAPSGGIAARIVEVSPHECYLDTPAPFSVQTQVVLKIFNSQEYFEAKATVIHVKPASGMGLECREIKPHFRTILQRWILAAMHDQKKP
jgi:hypothetical protein